VPELQHYIYKIVMTRPEMMQQATPEEDRIMADHFAYLKSHTESGKVQVAGPCTDGAFGIAIFTAASDEEAATFMDNDPAVQGGVMRAEVHPFRVSLRSDSWLGQVVSTGR